MDFGHSAIFVAAALSAAAVGSGRSGRSQIGAALGRIDLLPHALIGAALGLEVVALFAVARGAPATPLLAGLSAVAAVVAFTMACGVYSVSPSARAGLRWQETTPLTARESLLRRWATGLEAVPRQTWIGLSLIFSLWWVFMKYTRWPSVVKKSQIAFIQTQTAPQTFGEKLNPETWPYWLQWIPTGFNLNENNAVGMAFAFLIGGAVAALVLPGGIAARVRSARGFWGSAWGGLLGAPLMMCSACSVPIAIGWQRRGANLETMLGVVGGSALLNVMGLAAIWALFPGPLAIARLAASLALVLLVTPAVARFAVGPAPAPASAVRIDPAAAPNESSLWASRPSWTSALAGTLRSWWWSSVAIAHRLWLPMTAATFLAAAARLLLPPDVVPGLLGGGVVAIAATAAVGTLIAIPTLFEIPLVLGMLALGMGLGPATALLITAPSVSLITASMLRREVPGLALALMLAATWVVGTAAGLLVEGWITYVR